MKDLENSQLPVAPLNDVDLEQVSGGNLYLEGCNVYNLLSAQLQSILKPLENDIKNWENSVRYENVIKTLNTYGPPESINTDKAVFFANSWNEKHPKSTKMWPAIANNILKIENKYDRAIVASLPTVEMIISTLTELQNA